MEEEEEEEEDWTSMTPHTMISDDIKSQQFKVYEY